VTAVRLPHAAAAVIATFGLLALAAPVHGQGRSGGAPGQQRPKAPGGTTIAPSPGQPTPAAVPLATWLDDASRMGRGDLWLGMSFAWWSVGTTRVFFAPSTFVMIGATDRVALGTSVPVYHLRDDSGLTTHGVSDIAVFGKIGLVDPERRPVGVAVAPVVVFQEGDGVVMPAGRHASWAVPISLEMRGRAGRLYGSAGYFSHGAAFFSTACELLLTSKLAMGGTFGAAASTRDDEPLASLRKNRMDGSASVFVMPSSSVSLSFSVGRSFSGDASVDGGPWIAAGFSLLRSR
jgi:hypothetical protein